MSGTPLRRLVAAGTLIGIGMGGFVDGIVFHQILQLHGMLSNRLPRDSVVNLEVNMFWDGVFHAFCWLTVAAGIVASWRVMSGAEVRGLGRCYAGAMLLGWGAFNLVEGVIDHEVLRIHHVFQNGSHVLWDMVFLASGVALVAVGGAMIRQRAVRRGGRSANGGDDGGT